MRTSGEMAEALGGYNAGVITDVAAVERTLAGEREAYRVLVERHSNYVYRLAFRMTGNPHDAEEVVQEAFLPETPILQRGFIGSPRIMRSTGCGKGKRKTRGGKLQHAQRKAEPKSIR
jgi:hypothetical protein